MGTADKLINLRNREKRAISTDNTRKLKDDQTKKEEVAAKVLESIMPSTAKMQRIPRIPKKTEDKKEVEVRAGKVVEATRKSSRVSPRKAVAAKEATPKKKKDPQPVNLLKKVEKGKEPTKETKVVPDEASKASHLSTLMDQMDQEDRLTLDKDDKKEVTETNMKEDKTVVVKKGSKKATEETKTKLVEEMRIKAAQIMASLETTQETSAKEKLPASTTLKDVDLNTPKKVFSNSKESRERKET